MKIVKFLMTLMVLLGFCADVQACTGILLKAKDGSVVHGRTLEFGLEINPSVIVVPRNYSYTATTPQGPGMTYRAKYASIGFTAFNYSEILDGINEQGLSVGTFYFPGFASYEPLTSKNQSRALSPIDFPNWILTSFATLDEVQNALNNVVIVPTVYKQWGTSAPPFHYIVYDKEGKSLVIEPINGKLKVSQNPLGVFTNSPEFDWHMVNLRNYVNLTPFNAKPLKVGNLVFEPLGQGSGMVGLPGDFTPPSRFVRAAIFSITATPSANASEGIFQTFHLLNQFDIPVGFARVKEGGVVYTDYTMITVARNPKELTYFFKTYEDQAIRFVDLKKFDRDSQAIKRFDTSTFKQRAEDISADLK